MIESLTDTPETDAVREADWHRMEEYSAPLSAYKRMTELSRTLERGRNEAREQRDRLAETLRDIKDRAQDTTIMLHPDADAKGCVDDVLEWSESALTTLVNPEPETPYHEAR